MERLVSMATAVRIWSCIPVARATVHAGSGWEDECGFKQRGEEEEAFLLLLLFTHTFSFGSQQDVLVLPSL